MRLDPFSPQAKRAAEVARELLTLRFEAVPGEESPLEFQKALSAAVTEAAADVEFLGCLVVAQTSLAYAAMAKAAGGRARTQRLVDEYGDEAAEIVNDEQTDEEYKEALAIVLPETLSYLAANEDRGWTF